VFTAKSRAVKAWAGVRRAQKEEAAKLGVDGVVALDDDAEMDRIQRLDGIAGTLGGETIRKLFARVKPAGAIGSVLGAPAGASAGSWSVGCTCIPIRSASRRSGG